MTTIIKGSTEDSSNDINVSIIFFNNIDIFFEILISNIINYLLYFAFYNKKNENNCIDRKQNAIDF